MTTPPNQPPPGGFPSDPQQPGSYDPTRQYSTGQPYQAPGQSYPPGGQQPPVAGQPYAQYPPQGQPYPPYQGGVPTPPKKSRKTLWIVLGSVAGVIILGIVTLAILGATVFKDNVSGSDDVAVGDCITVSADGKSSVKPKKTDCGSTGFHFAIASKVANGSACGEDYSQLSFYSGSDTSNQKGDVLCLAPIFQEGKCYQAPESDSDTSLAEVKEVSCSQRSDSQFTVLKVESKTQSAPTCEDSQSALHYDKPSEIGYCLSKVE